MVAIERIQNFNPQLLNAFDKMVRGINVELTKEFRDNHIKWLKNNKQDERLERWWFIQSINSDESLDLCSNSHSIIRGVKISDCVL
jgi:hypothetical protein